MKSKIILVCGLPGAGKTYFATRLKDALGDTAVHINGDDVRKLHNDWDFSDEGRLRQAHRMKHIANQHLLHQHVILDFIAPKQEYRDIIAADVIVWADRTPVRDFPDTTAMFEPLKDWNYRIDDDQKGVNELVGEIAYLLRVQNFDTTAPTALMIGRFQPFHDGHKALFLKALEKHGQVCIGVRTLPQDEKNPFRAHDVVHNIREELSDYADRVTVVQLPNIVDVVYGRDVGWTVSKIDLPEEIEAISATKIREAMKK